ncbi:MAG: LysR family transcriptional regulator [Bradyrhizobium sp.]|jgi:DNA-binding transcriptional LysR family regulator|uniref:LysR family transcriptional regulator n=2 Tax=Bradyrhizobium TaxID=374 RepID=A0ABS5GH99_9BRAD|nr:MULTISPECIES: LysR family transcriptional regulator [Bradyrhizobium]RTL91215.1 MAG: LysR family transcriptional regulator [Bradyrhizobiaceae bacterium]ABQ33655.1 transcriptional regulator, LysR family [Bradyrhizobium sp. BTAi1]MBR1140722.1 LysR family transcriptional regulator [Bradyrhizobium denitrificans]MCL8488032.1 LysR family transcriptional regulator [Bradyrhizobium denitrificans]MDH6264132.1 DNA-binding transcriptional LysR family regulator [Bradyrhizobium sp. BR13661]
MDIVSSLAALVRVTETGSFSAVARERDVSKAAVTRQIAFLEEHFGVRLLHRTTRKLSLTEDGRTLLDLARPVLEGVETMEATLGRQSTSPVGLVRVGIMVAASHFLAPRLPTLLASNPGLQVELIVNDRFGDMIEDRLDLAMRAGEITDVSVVARRIGIAARVVVAAPRYIEARGHPSTPVELGRHTCIVHDVGPDSDMWTFGGSHGAEEVRVSGSIRANDGAVVHLAARAGYGIAFLPLVQVVDDLRSGALVRVLGDRPSPGLPLSLTYSSRRHLAPRTRVVMEFIIEQVRQMRGALAATSDESIL